jgi:glycosyltransferase involved in cell wall biosynthesis
VNLTKKNGSRVRVVIVERQLLHYRVDFYERLRDLLHVDGVELQLLVGTGTSVERKRRDEVAVHWATPIAVRYFLWDMLCWLPFGEYAKDADMVIVAHENKMIYNLWLIFFNRPKRIAFWGHGANLQSSRPEGWKERFKRWTVGKVDWWFAYTDSSAKIVEQTGFASSRITVVENAVDTAKMKTECATITREDSHRLRQDLGLEEGPIGLFVGSLYREKMLGFLLEAAHLIRERTPGFSLLIVGAGPEQAAIDEATRHFPWIRCMGPLRGRQKSEVLMLADVMLNPGLVGLGILDSFVSGRPMFTTNCGVHSPEISYLTNWKNGVMTPMNRKIYAETVSEVLQHPEMIEILRLGALASASRYTLENMAGRIRDGICACLLSR